MTLDFSRVTLGAPLWTVADVKTIQLRLTDTAHDADVAEKLDTAQEVIIAYLGAAADATWTAETAPKAVKHAILLLTTHYYEDRGDDMVTDERVWAAIARLLAFYRDPSLS